MASHKTMGGIQLVRLHWKVLRSSLYALGVASQIALLCHILRLVLYLLLLLPDMVSG